MPATDLRLHGSDGGAGLLAVFCLLAVALLGASGLITLTFGALEATRARTAADLGALATLNWGPSVGAEVALANGGEVLTIERFVLSATVEVRFGGVEVVARSSYAD